jgi:hypothetical protein
VAAVPDLRNGEGKKSPLSRLPADDNTESATYCTPSVSMVHSRLGSGLRKVERAGLRRKQKLCVWVCNFFIEQ